MASVAYQFDFLLAPQRANGAFLSGGKAYFYEVGTSTPKTVWLDAEMTQPVAGDTGVALDGNGTALVYGDGAYKVVLKNAAGVTVISRPRVDASRKEILEAITDRVTSLEDHDSLVIYASDYSSLAEAINAAAATGGNKTLRINKLFPATDNVTVPETLTLQFTESGMLSISMGKTVTINGRIDADFRQIFQFADSAAAVTTTNPAQWGGKSYIKYDIKVDWFGAVPDAITPAYNAAANAVPTGTDSSDAIRRAVKFAQAGSIKYGEIAGGGCPRVVACPGGKYLVRGTNLLGNQLVSDAAFSQKNTYYRFDGNGASFLWIVDNTTDTFIDYARTLYDPQFYNFRVTAYGFTGIRGKFFATSSGGSGYNSMQGGTMERVHVYGGRAPGQGVTPGLGNGLSKMFDVDGTNLNDRMNVIDCEFMEYETFYYGENSEAVNWRWESNTLVSYVPNHIVWYLSKPFSGGLVITGNDILMKADNAKLFYAPLNGAASSTQGEVFFQSRVETYASATTFHLIDAEHGTFRMETLNAAAGNSSFASKSGFVTAKLRKGATASFFDCQVPSKVILEAKTQSEWDTATVSQALVETLTFRRCRFQQNRLLPEFQKSDGTVVSFSTALSTGLYTGMVSAKECPRVDGVFGIDSGTYFALSNHETLLRYGYRGAGGSAGYIYINEPTASSYTLRVPQLSLVTSIKVTVATVSASVADSLAVYFGSTLIGTVPLSATARTNAEVIPTDKAGVALPYLSDDSNLLLSIKPRKAGVDVNANVPGYAYVRAIPLASMLMMPSGAVPEMK